MASQTPTSATPTSAAFDKKKIGKKGLKEEDDDDTRATKRNKIGFT
jgi:hypothetical protein